METVSITVLDRTGAHTALWVPPVSLQPRVKAPIAAPRFDRSAIMKAAWLDYRAAVRKGWTGRGFDRERWSYCLGIAWMLAKVAERKARPLPPLVITAPLVIADPDKRARAETIKGELLAIEMSDAYRVPVAGRQLALEAELATLTAA